MELIKQYSFPIAVVVVIIGIAFFVFGPSQNSSSPTATPIAEKQTQTPKESNTKKMEKPTMQLDSKKEYSAIIHTTAGDISVLFDTTNTPITSNNFITLAKAHFYDNVIFHRTIPGFMIQGGDPDGTGMGGPGYSFDDEYLQGKYTRGTVAMANAGANTNGSQFFIMHKDYALPNSYVIFAHVISGIETVDKIATAPTKPQGEGSSPVSPITITSIDILEK